MDWAVIQFSGKQYIVKPGGKITVENINRKTGEAVNFEEVLLVADGAIAIGNPYLKNFVVTGKITKNFAGSKITVTKFRPKSRYLRRTGFRQKYTEIEITKIRSTSKT